VIYAHLPDSGDKVLLVHGYTGAYDLVSRSVAAYLRSLEQRPVSKPLYGEWLPEELDGDRVVKPSDGTLDVLKRRGYLTTRTLEEEEAYFIRHVAALHEAERRRVPGYVIMPTYDCNLRCAYCFQDHMRTDPRYNHLLRTMSRPMADRILGSLPQIEALHSLEASAGFTRTFTFFGGEPLLKQSRPTIEYIISKAKSMGPATFGAISNATELEWYADLLGPDGIAWLQITLDGPREEHDKRRVRPDKSGSFDETSANVGLALERGVKVSIRMNADRSNLGMIPQLADHFAAAGWSAYPNFSAYVAPVHDYNEIGTRKDYFNSWELGRAVDELKAAHGSMRTVNAVDSGLAMRARAIFAGEQDGLPEKASFCGAHKGMYIFDAFGDIYSCWDRTGDKNVRIGTVHESGEVELNALNALWRERTVASNKTCRNCRFALYCGGGCAILAETVSGTMFSNHCDAFGKRFRAKVAEAYVDFSSGRTQRTPAADAAVALQESLL
jgi:uncharacterized protein